MLTYSTLIFFWKRSRNNLLEIHKKRKRKVKKTIAIILAVIMAASICGCSQNTVEEKLPDVTEVTPAPTQEPDYDAQMKLIEDSREMWTVEDWSPWFYTVNDLDHNGRLDLIVASLQGTGMYTYANCWEVNEAHDALVKCVTDAEEEDSWPAVWPDIIKDSTDCYYDRTANRYYYVFEDELKNGYLEYYFSKMAVCLHDGAVDMTVLSGKSVLYESENGAPTLTFTDKDGNPITEEEYEKAADNYFEGLEKTQVYFDWTEIETQLQREPNLIFASDLFDGYGYVHQLCDQTGVYDFSAINSDGVTWEVYILDKEFDDAERFIPQAYEKALSGNGSLSVKEGEWIYIYCPCNQWTMQVAPEGCAFSWNLNPEKEYTEREVPQGPVPEITKNPTAESLSVGGKTWFIAYADGADTVEWELINPSDGRGYSPAQAMALCKGLTAEVIDGNTLAIDNAPLELNGWKAKAIFKNSFGKAETTPALITVEDFIAKYKTILENYKTMTPSDDVSEMVTYSKHIGYALKDLDKNGIPELLIAGAGTDDFSQNMIYDIYTISGDTPVRLAVSGARNRFYVMTDSRILNQGSNGAAYNVNYVFKVTGTEMNVTEGVLSGLDDQNNIVWYYSTDSDYDFSNDTQISEQQANETVSAWEAAIYLPQLTKIV